MSLRKMFSRCIKFFSDCQRRVSSIPLCRSRGVPYLRLDDGQLSNFDKDDSICITASTVGFYISDSESDDFKDAYSASLEVSKSSQLCPQLLSDFCFNLYHVFFYPKTDLFENDEFVKDVELFCSSVLEKYRNKIDGVQQQRHPFDFELYQTFGVYALPIVQKFGVKDYRYDENLSRFYVNIMHSWAMYDGGKVCDCEIHKIRNCFDETDGNRQNGFTRLSRDRQKV